MNAVEERNQIRAAMQARAEAVERLETIRAAAERALRDGSAVIAIELTRDSAPTAERIRLAGHGGPLGELVNARPFGDVWRVVGTFKCAAVIAWASKEIRTLLAATIAESGFTVTSIREERNAG